MVGRGDWDRSKWDVSGLRWGDGVVESWVSVSDPGGVGSKGLEAMMALREEEEIDDDDDDDVVVADEGFADEDAVVVVDATVVAVVAAVAVSPAVIDNGEDGMSALVVSG